jgi:predicted enzyme related to lactoylglutathione lyase
MDLGRMAFFTDPTGAAFGVWQPKGFAGADLVNEPNSLIWSELLTRDTEADKPFYEAVFGWTAGKPSFEEAPKDYVVWELDGKPVGGMARMTDDMFPPEVPPHWGVCFAVADCDAIVARAGELGATVVVAPMGMSLGRFAVMLDPQGAAFTVMQPAPSG